VYDEAEMHDLFRKTSGGSDQVTFEQFIRFMVDITEDRNTAGQVLESFRDVADGKPYVTELDLRHSLISPELVEEITKTMPRHSGPEATEQDRDLAKYDYKAFMDRFLGPEQSKGGEARPV